MPWRQEPQKVGGEALASQILAGYLIGNDLQIERFLSNVDSKHHIEKSGHDDRPLANDELIIQIIVDPAKCCPGPG